MTVAPAAGGHGHVITFGATTGSHWLRVLLIVGAIVVAAYGMLRPFLDEQEEAVVRTVTAIAGGGALLQLLLADGLDVPRPAVVLLLAVAAVPLVRAIRRDPRTTPLGRALGHGAPWVVLATAVVVATEVTRAWIGGGAVTELLQTALLVALVGLAWLTLCRPRTRRGSLALGAVAWVLANGLLAGTAHSAVLAVSTA